MKNEQQPVNTYDALNNVLAQLVKVAENTPVVSGTTLATIAHAVVAVTDRIDSVPDDVKHRAECNRIGRAVAAALREAVGLDAS